MNRDDFVRDFPVDLRRIVDGRNSIRVLVQKTPPKQPTFKTININVDHEKKNRSCTKQRGSFDDELDVKIILVFFSREF